MACDEGTFMLKFIYLLLVGNYLSLFIYVFIFLIWFVNLNSQKIRRKESIHSLLLFFNLSSLILRQVPYSCDIYFEFRAPSSLPV